MIKQIIKKGATPLDLGVEVKEVDVNRANLKREYKNAPILVHEHNNIVTDYLIKPTLKKGKEFVAKYSYSKEEE